jgi:alpha-tubulin suppressor-like RCC1 family protein
MRNSVRPGLLLGSNSNGELGDGSTSSSTTLPVSVYTGGVLAGRTLIQIVAGGSSTCALDSTGLAYCSGLDSSGQLGNSTPQSPVPVAG